MGSARSEIFVSPRNMGNPGLSPHFLSDDTPFGLDLDGLLEFLLAEIVEIPLLVSLETPIHGIFLGKNIVIVVIFVNQEFVDRIVVALS